MGGTKVVRLHPGRSAPLDISERKSNVGTTEFLLGLGEAMLETFNWPHGHPNLSKASHRLMSSTRETMSVAYYIPGPLFKCPLSYIPASCPRATLENSRVLRRWAQVLAALCVGGQMARHLWLVFPSKHSQSWRFWRLPSWTSMQKPVGMWMMRSFSYLKRWGAWLSKHFQILRVVPYPASGRRQSPFMPGRKGTTGTQLETHPIRHPGRARRVPPCGCVRPQCAMRW